MLEPQVGNESPRDSCLPTLLFSVSFGLVVSDVMGTSLSQSGCVVFLFLPEGLFLFMEEKERQLPRESTCNCP